MCLLFVGMVSCRVYCSQYGHTVTLPWQRFYHIFSIFLVISVYKKVHFRWKISFTYIPVRVSLLKIHLKRKSWASGKRGRKILKARNSVIWNKGSLKQTTSVVFNPMGFSVVFFFYFQIPALNEEQCQIQKGKKIIYTKLEMCLEI